MRYYLDFEKKLEPLERRMLEIERFYGFNDPRFSKEIAGLTKKISKLEKEIYGELTNLSLIHISEPTRPY